MVIRDMEEFSATAHLQTKEDKLAYLDAVPTESDPELTIAALNYIAQAQGETAVDG